MVGDSVKATVDGTVSFVQLALEVGSWRRQTMERAAAGLECVVSVDMGGRSRALVQRGEMRAFSGGGLEVKLAAVRGLMDGRVHTLAVSDGRSFANVRVDSVAAGDRVYGGGGVRCEFEVRYTQLGA